MQTDLEKKVLDKVVALSKERVAFIGYCNNNAYEHRNDEKKIELKAFLQGEQVVVQLPKHVEAHELEPVLFLQVPELQKKSAALRKHRTESPDFNEALAATIKQADYMIYLQ